MAHNTSLMHAIRVCVNKKKMYSVKIKFDGLHPSLCPHLASKVQASFTAISEICIHHVVSQT